MNDVQKNLEKEIKTTTYFWNNPDGSLPFSLYSREHQDRLLWICDRDKDNAIVSIFQYTNIGGEKEYKTEELKNMDAARFFRDELLKSGWIPRFHPKIEVKTS